MRSSFESDRRELIENLDYLFSLPVKEYTLRKKWDELQNHLFPHRAYVHQGRASLWNPKLIETNRDDGKYIEQSVEDGIKILQVKIVICNTKKENEQWELLRVFGSTAEYNGGFGPRIKFFVKDTTYNRILGIGELASDFGHIENRDDYIGWTDEEKYDGGGLRHTAALSTCVPTQPFGSNWGFDFIPIQYPQMGNHARVFERSNKINPAMRQM